MGERGGAGGELAYGTGEKKCPMLQINFCAMKDRGAVRETKRKQKKRKQKGLGSQEINIEPGWVRERGDSGREGQTSRDGDYLPIPRLPGKSPGPGPDLREDCLFLPE